MAGTSVVVDLLLKAKDLASAPIRTLVSSLQFLDSQVSVVAGKIRGAFTGLFGGGMEGAIEFEAQLSRVAAKGGFTASEMAKLKQAATDIGAKFGTTGTDAAKGMEALAAAGLNAEQVMQALPPVMALAQAEGLSMDATAEKLSDSLATMGLGFDQAARLANVLAKGANISTTSASALAEALATGGGIARDFGLNMEETVGALTAFASSGIKGSAAGTALQAILTQLINPSSQASKALSALGIETRDFGEVIGALKDKGQASNAAILAFGETAGPGLRALVKLGQQGVADLTGQLKSADGAAEKAAAGVSGNLKGALASLVAAWGNVKTALFDPVLEPLTKQANALAETLNTQLASGALKPVQEAIRSFATNAIQAARDFIAHFDFQAALLSLQNLATGAKDAFAGIQGAGTTAAGLIQIAWNGLTAGVKTIGATLLAVAASAVSNLAAIEEAASKIGLGSAARAAELQATANELAAKASALTRAIAQDGADIQGAFSRLANATTEAKAGVAGLADEQKRLKESVPAAEISEIARSLADYQGMATRAADATQQARREYESGKISAAEYGRALLASAEANAELAAATNAQVEAEQRASPQRKKSALELEATAKAAEDGAKRQGDYADALGEAGNAQAEAIRAEIELARAKGNSAVVAAKTIELARMEATTARQVADAKQQEAAEMAKVVAAQQAYLASINGGSAAQQQELQILQLKLATLQAEAKQAGITAQVKALAAQQTQAQTQTTQQNATATAENADAQNQANQATADGISLTKMMQGALDGARERTQALSAATGELFEKLFLTFSQGEPTAFSTATSQMLVSLGKVEEKYAELTGEIARANAASKEAAESILFGANSVIRFFGYVEKAEAEARKAYFEQKLAAAQLADSLKELEETGASSFGTMGAALSYVNGTAKTAIDNFNLLNEQDLAELNDALDQTNEKLKSIQEEAASARDRLAELNAEIAAEKGDQALSERLKLQLEQQRALAEVEERLAEARRNNNRELIDLYEEQKRKLAELYDLKERNLEQESRQQQESQQGTKDLHDMASAADRAHESIGKLSGASIGPLLDQVGQLRGQLDAVNDLL